ncbi:hypothetical protein KY334_05410 [Candidatus Woesearchaeota archaeon]|nr:hypothetical protein [Candidatus Woesearchaeota archaeon]
MDKILEKILCNLRMEFDNQIIAPHSNISDEDYKIIKQEIEKNKTFVEKIAIELYKKLPKGIKIIPMDAPVDWTDREMRKGPIIEAKSWEFEYKIDLKTLENMNEDAALRLITRRLSKELNKIVSDMKVFRPYMLVQIMRAIPMEEVEKWEKDKTHQCKLIMGFRTRFGM